MTDDNRATMEAEPPHFQLVQMAMGHWVSRIVYVAAKLDLADRLANGPKSADELAGPTGTHAPRCIGSCERWRRSASSARATAVSSHSRLSARRSRPMRLAPRARRC